MLIKSISTALVGHSVNAVGRVQRLTVLCQEAITALAPPMRRTLIRSILHGLAGLATTFLLWPETNDAILLGWLALLSCCLFFAYKSEASKADRPIVRTVSALSTALTWCIPLFLATADHQVPLWAICAALIAASAALLPGNPRSTYMLAGILGLLHAVSFRITGDTDLAIVALLLSSAIILGAAQNARRLKSAVRSKAAMREKEEVVSLLLREFQEGGADWLWHIDDKQCVHSASSRFSFALGKQPEAIEHCHLIDLLAGGGNSQEVNASLIDLRARLLTREAFAELPVRVLVNGERRWWQLSGTPKIDGSGRFTGFHGVASDITIERENTDKIAYLARHDTLTGLPNRSMLSENLTKALRYAERTGTPCAFLMIDLDRFKAVNDTLGHQVGDQLLAQLSDRLHAEMGDGQLCCRMGGDEFAVIVSHAHDAKHIANVAHCLIDRLSQPYMIGQHTLSVGASIGSALGPRDGATVETLIHNADLALYRAKANGGNVHIAYDPSLLHQAEERHRIEADLRAALGAGELEVHYQPVVDAKTEHIVQMEALLRWNNAERGLVNTSKFIRIAEDTRLMVPIGEWVLRRACIEAVNWPPHISIAVNVSGQQLRDADFVPMVVSALTKSGLAPQRLEIEVNESIFDQEESVVRAVLDQIIALGCTVALDDFGTGHSSLSYLRELRFSAIKIDRSFVRDATKGHAESLAIIRAVVAVAESLEMSTTAEGVETLAELELIRRLGCCKAQGFRFGKAMSAETVAQIFEPRQISAL